MSTHPYIVPQREQARHIYGSTGPDYKIYGPPCSDLKQLNIWYNTELII